MKLIGPPWNWNGKTISWKKNNWNPQKLNRELEASRNEIEGTKNYLENILESSVDAIVSTDRKYKVDFFSRGAVDTFGYSPPDIVGSHIKKLFEPKMEQFSLLLKELKKTGRIHHYEARMRHTSGNIIITDISASMLKPVHGHKGLLLIIKDIAEQKRLERELKSSNIELEKLAVTDGLTGLFNHRYFQKCLGEEFQRARRYKSDLSLIMLDLDDFKRVNDTFGHQVGDITLTTVSDLIRESVREVDIPARYGGEEFAVILPQTDVKSAIPVAERLKEAIEKSDRFSKIHDGLSVTASLGLAGYQDQDILTAQELIKFADRALFRAKQIGKNRIVIGGLTGDKPLGLGEFLTPTDKKSILRRVGNTIRSTLDLAEVLSYLLKEISEALKQTEKQLPCSVMLMDQQLGLRTVAESLIDKGRRYDFEVAAHLALEKRNVQVFQAGEPHGPTTSYPIIVTWPDRGEEVVGIINIGTVPVDLDFFRDLAGQASMGILNAKLLHEVDQSKSAMEHKVNQLMTLSLMGMAMQRNALTREDFNHENRMLLARCLARIKFDRVFVYRLDVENSSLTSGVDNSLRGNDCPATINLDGLTEHSVFLRPFVDKMDSFSPVVFFSAINDLESAEQQILETLNVHGGEVAIAKMSEGERDNEIVIAVKNRIDPEDVEALSMFVLHAGLIMENLHLTRLFQEKTERLTMVYEMGLNLAVAASPEASNKAVQEALNDLTDILRASEISLYTYGKNKSLTLMSFTSATASPGHEPLQKPRKRDSGIMNLVIDQAKKTGKPEPLVINDLRKNPNYRPRKRFTTKAYLGLPLFCGGKLLGIMNLTGKLDRDDFSRDDAELAQITAGILSSFLHYFSLIQGLKDRTLETIKSMIEVLESAKPGPGRGHSRRVAEIAAGLAGIMGAGEQEMVGIRQEALIHDFKNLSAPTGHPQPPEPFRSLGLIMGDWLKHLEQAGFFRPGSRRDGDRTKDFLLGKVLTLSEVFETSWLGVPPRNRPGLEQVLLDIIIRTDRDFDIDAVEALLIGLSRGELKSGRRRITPERKVFENLAATLKEKKYPVQKTDRLFQRIFPTNGETNGEDKENPER